MVKSKYHIPRTHLSVAMQNLFVQKSFPQFSFSGICGVGTWRGTLQPTPISPVYQILVKYNVNNVPHVWVLSPEIKGNAPHRYKDKSLCLYWHKEWNWSPDQDISKTIIAWTAFWLYFYEIWLDTGEWLAESAPHAPPQ
ncbi:MAG: hypothetical protein A2Z69_00495 [Bacteroidetes bacterium RBG_13_44_24]|nr:MAG: hypothetical protein A2Z69_00495 [Bacteroidetes bacterium RBG_13_44_24]